MKIDIKSKKVLFALGLYGILPESLVENPAQVFSLEDPDLDLYISRDEMWLTPKDSLEDWELVLFITRIESQLVVLVGPYEKTLDSVMHTSKPVNMLEYTELQNQQDSSADVQTREELLEMTANSQRMLKADEKYSFHTHTGERLLLLPISRNVPKPREQDSLRD